MRRPCISQPGCAVGGLSLIPLAAGTGHAVPHGFPVAALCLASVTTTQFYALHFGFKPSAS